MRDTTVTYREQRRRSRSAGRSGHNRSRNARSRSVGRKGHLLDDDVNWVPPVLTARDGTKRKDGRGFRKKEGKQQQAKHKELVKSMDLAIDDDGFLVPRGKKTKPEEDEDIYDVSSSEGDGDYDSEGDNFDNDDEEEYPQGNSTDDDSISVPYCKLLSDGFGDNEAGFASPVGCKSKSTLATEAMTPRSTDSGAFGDGGDGFTSPNPRRSISISRPAVSRSRSTSRSQRGRGRSCFPNQEDGDTFKSPREIKKIVPKIVKPSFLDDFVSPLPDPSPSVWTEAKEQQKKNDKEEDLFASPKTPSNSSSRRRSSRGDPFHAPGITSTTLGSSSGTPVAGRTRKSSIRDAVQALDLEPKTPSNSSRKILSCGTPNTPSSRSRRGRLHPTKSAPIKEGSSSNRHGSSGRTMSRNKSDPITRNSPNKNNTSSSKKDSHHRRRLDSLKYLDSDDNGDFLMSPITPSSGRGESKKDSHHRRRLQALKCLEEEDLIGSPITPKDKPGNRRLSSKSPQYSTSSPNHNPYPSTIMTGAPKSPSKSNHHHNNFNYSDRTPSTVMESCTPTTSARSGHTTLATNYSMASLDDHFDRLTGKPNRILIGDLPFQAYNNTEEVSEAGAVIIQTRKVRKS